MENAFVTKFNFCRIATELNNCANDVDINEVHKIIFHENLSLILNEKEAREKFVQFHLINEDANLFDKIIDSLEKKQKNLSRRSKFFVFDPTVPKFHLDKTCKFLNQNYLNYLIPTSIIEKGEEEINKFKDYCRLNRKKILEKPDVFWVVANAKFKITPPVVPQEIYLKNSGIETHPFLFSEKDVLDEINNAYEKCMKIIDENRLNETFPKYQYASPNKNIIELIKNKKEDYEILVSYMEQKKIIFDNLLNYYFLKSKKENFGLPLKILQKFYMQPCKACCK